MRRLIHISLAAVFLVAALAEPVVALQATHACCPRPAAPAEKPSCHSHHGAPAVSVSETHSAHGECPNRCCCLGTAPQTAPPESSRTWTGARHSFANARAFELQPLSQAELPVPSGRAPPSHLFC